MDIIFQAAVSDDISTKDGPQVNGGIAGVTNHSVGGDISYARGKPAYEGPYEVVSLPWRSQVFETKNTTMTDDLTVLEIPYAETTNEYGTTVSISS